MSRSFKTINGDTKMKNGYDSDGALYETKEDQSDQQRELSSNQNLNQIHSKIFTNDLNITKNEKKTEIFLSSDRQNSKVHSSKKSQRFQRKICERIISEKKKINFSISKRIKKKSHKKDALKKDTKKSNRIDNIKHWKTKICISYNSLKVKKLIDSYRKVGLSHYLDAQESNIQMNIRIKLEKLMIYERQKIWCNRQIDILSKETICIKNHLDSFKRSQNEFSK